MTSGPPPAEVAPTPLDAATRDAFAALLLSVADDEFVIGFWDSEWTGIAPMLEEDVATSSIAQDELGHAKALYEMLAELTDDDADRIAFGRAAGDFRHAPLLDHRRTDWAFTVARRWLYETADAVRLEALARSTYEPLAGLAGKMRREETYHLMHWEVWMRRLTEAPGDVPTRLRSAVERLWPEAQGIFATHEHEERLLAAGLLPEPMESLRRRWLERAVPALAGWGIEVPPDVAPPDANARTRHGYDFAWLHNEFTMVARSEEGATW